MKIKLHDCFITLALFAGINQGTAQNYNLEVITGLRLMTSRGRMSRSP